MPTVPQKVQKVHSKNLFEKITTSSDGCRKYEYMLSASECQLVSDGLVIVGTVRAKGQENFRLSAYKIRFISVKESDS